MKKLQFKKKKEEIFFHSVFVTCFIALFVFLMRQLQCDCREIGEDKTRSDPIFNKTFPPQLKCLLCQHSLSRCDKSDSVYLSIRFTLTLKLQLTLAMKLPRDWRNLRAGREEVFMIKSIVGWHNNAQLISSLWLAAEPAAVDPDSEKYGNSDIWSIKEMQKRTSFKIMHQFKSITIPHCKTPSCNILENLCLKIVFAQQSEKKSTSDKKYHIWLRWIRGASPHLCTYIVKMLNATSF